MLASEARELDPRDPQASAVLIEALWQANEVDRLEEFVAKEGWMASDGQCGLVLARIRVHQSRLEDASDLCRRLVDADPDDPNARLLLGECLLLLAQDGRRLPLGQTDEILARLGEAEAEATRAVDILQTTDLKARHRSALVTRAGARALRGNTAAALSDCEEVLREAPTHPDARFNKGLLLLHSNRPGEAREAFEGILESDRREDIVLPLAEACLEIGDAAAATTLLRGTISLDRPGWQDIHRASTLTRAEAGAREEDTVGPLLEAALKRAPDDPRLLVLAAERRELVDDASNAEDLLLRALERADGADRPDVSIRLATHYQEQERFSEAADRYGEVVQGGATHPAAIRLLVCLVNSKRLREALGWAREIRAVREESPRLVLEVEADILEHVGDVASAVSCRQELLSRADATPLDRLRLGAALFRSGDHPGALQNVLAVDRAGLRDRPRELVRLAQLKVLLGADDYLTDAYVARRYGPDDPVAHLGYVGLFMGREDGWNEPAVIGAGCAVRLKSGSTERWWQILDEGEEPRGSYELQPSHDLAQRLLGRQVGDSVVLRQDLEELSYEITAVQSKFVRAFQEALEEFSTRFPGHMGLSRIEVKDQDFTKVLLGIDERERVVREVDRLYREGRLPFASFCGLVGRSLPEVWRGCTQHGLTHISFGSGSDGEATKASELLREADSVVLDLLALLTVRELDLAEALRARFSRIAVPQHVLDALQELAFTTTAMGSVSGYLGKADDGRYSMAEISEEEWRQWREDVQALVEFAESFERVAAYRVLDVRAEEADRLVDMLTAAGVGAIYASGEHASDGLTLISDDLGLRLVAHSLGIDAVNTQAVLQELRRSDVISNEKYSFAVERLVSLNYRFVRIHPADIIRRLEANGYVTTEGTRAMLRTLEGPECSADSAISVATEVIASLQGNALLTQVELILATIIAALQRGRERTSVLLEFRDALESRLALAPLSQARLLRSVDMYIQLQT